MLYRLATMASAGVLIGMLGLPPSAPTQADTSKPVAAANGLVRVKSAHGFDETIARIKADVEAKGITFFQQIDQSRLAAEAGIQIRPSTLLVFGNPALGTQFMARNPEAGIDWPVRVLVYQDVGGTVWAAYTDFGWIARRHAIADDAPFKKAAEVIASVTGSVAK